MTGWATTGTGESVRLAGAGARLGARIIDWVILIVLVIGVSAVVGVGSDSDEISGQSLGVLTVTALLSAVVGILYEGSMIALKGQTLGKMATRVKVVRADNGLLPGWRKSLSRWIIPAALAFIPFVGWLLSLLVYISLLWDNVRQGWHDKTAGTLVIKV